MAGGSSLQAARPPQNSTTVPRDFYQARPEADPKKNLAESWRVFRPGFPLFYQMKNGRQTKTAPKKNQTEQFLKLKKEMKGSYQNEKDEKKSIVAVLLRSVGSVPLLCISVRG